MSILPDELWRSIMEIGIESKTLDYKSLCCLSISSRRLRRLSAEDSLWSTLLLSDFPSKPSDTDQTHVPSSSTSQGKLKSLYKVRYEKDRDQRRLAHRRAVLRIESQVSGHQQRIQAIKRQSSAEKDKLNNALAELLNLHRVRKASAALNVWQPNVIRGSQKEMVQQCNVPIDVRINQLEMELNLCKQQIAGFDKSLKLEKRRLAAAKEQLDSVKYHPLQVVSRSSFQLDESGAKSKKLKHSVP